ncbi:MAG: hypothetical protein AB7S86_04360 [Hydrogenophaga sp.]|uniref:hypothetical protein n=1 Tax=Hydrogenophaga sp. TaxID=1904254 RepID=UPI003D0BD87A
MIKTHSQDLTRQALDAAGDLSDRVARAAHNGIDTVRHQASRVGEQTVGYVRDEPVKSLMAAAAVGALAGLLIGWLGRSRRPY